MNARTRQVVIGGIAWVLVVQYFVMLVISQSRWTAPYSWSRNAISDLGAATCHRSDQLDGWVCSPWHVATNISWTIAGVCMCLGAVLVRPALPSSRVGAFGLGLVFIAGIGLCMVALNPEDTAKTVHVSGAAIAIGSLAFGTFLIGVALWRADRRNRVGALGLTFGATAIVGIGFMLARIGGTAQFGLWERIAAFPGLLYLIALGFQIVRDTRDPEFQRSKPGQSPSTPAPPP
ncbi:MAG: hypothetical protein JWN03_8007 [Nocardia sp.]|uniref:DUF998 domain-containing protein n=1 Tax=Nocardia sp. TaxID=1821 RepID=UPI00261E3AF2|nr:DUF998 domain-containing protein [Nocardia sp.]MCU1647732.1 hypothetical protein [Nocardia sp.]